MVINAMAMSSCCDQKSDDAHRRLSKLGLNLGVAGPADAAAQLQPAVSILVSRAEQKGGVSLQHTLSKFYCLV